MLGFSRAASTGLASRLLVRGLVILVQIIVIGFGLRVAFLFLLLSLVAHQCGVHVNLHVLDGIIEAVLLVLFGLLGILLLLSHGVDLVVGFRFDRDGLELVGRECHDVKLIRMAQL